MNDADLNDAVAFFRARLRGVENATFAQLKRWTLHKLRNDAQATAELMLSEGYRAAYIRYFISYHIKHAEDYPADGAISIVISDLQRAARKLPQPYRDLAEVCFRWGYPLPAVIYKLEGKLKDEYVRTQVVETR